MASVLAVQLPAPALDRSLEFQRILAERQARQKRPAPPPADRPARASRSEFHAQASQIGADIYACAEKLGKLTQLAQSRSLFEETGQAIEINQLMVIIKTDITELNTKLAQLQAHQAQVRSQQRRPNQQSNHSSSIVDSLKVALADATMGFKDVLQTRSQNMKLLHDRREQFNPAKFREAGSSSSDGSGGTANVYGNGFNFGAGAVPDGGGPPASIFECVSTDTANSSEGAGPSWATPGAKPLRTALEHPNGDSGAHVIDMAGLSPPQQVQLQQHVPSEYLEQRAQAVDNVTKTIAELGGIYQQLAIMVAEQGTALQRIDENVNDTLINVEAGNEQLQRYWQRLSSNRPLMLKVFAVLMFFITVWGAFFF